MISFPAENHACSGFHATVRLTTAEARLVVAGHRYIRFVARIHACIVNLMSRMRLQIVFMHHQAGHELVTRIRCSFLAAVDSLSLSVLSSTIMFIIIWIVNSSSTQISTAVFVYQLRNMLTSSIIIYRFQVNTSIPKVCRTLIKNAPSLSHESIKMCDNK